MLSITSENNKNYVEFLKDWVEIKNSIEILEDKAEKIFGKKEQRENEIV